MATLNQLLAPITSRGKRSRSNSTSSSTSSSATSSSGGNSIFSRFTSTDSSDSLSNCSSPATASSETSPYNSGTAYIGGNEDARPCKTQKRSIVATDSSFCLANLGLGSAVDRTALAPCGKTRFVDCLVDAAVDVLNVIWEAPIDRSIAFVTSDAPLSSNIFGSDGITTCKCPSMTRPMGPIPLDLFVRETLRRSRTSCSTLQTALLFCKRAGGEVIRRRAQKEQYQLSSQQLAQLPGADERYISLLQCESLDSDETIMCSRRVFLASVMISSKFLQDRTFSNRAWSKISGLGVKELSQVERRLLMALEFNLNVKENTWRDWTEFLKGDWNAGRPSKRCGLLHSVSQPVVEQTNRIALTRSCSVPEGSAIYAGEVLETDVAIPSGDEQAFYPTPAATAKRVDSSSSSSPPTVLSAAVDDTGKDVEIATPKAIEIVSGESTPKTVVGVSRAMKGSDHLRKTNGGQNLLIAAVYNHMQISSVRS